jgi:hypothetical protein
MRDDWLLVVDTALQEPPAAAMPKLIILSVSTDRDTVGNAQLSHDSVVVVESDKLPMTLVERLQTLEAGLGDVRQRLAEERRAKGAFESVLNAMREEAKKAQTAARVEQSNADSIDLLKGLHVAQSRKCETETDVEPTSPEWSAPKANLGLPRMKTKGQAKPTRLTLEAGPEKIWSAMLEAQATLLGPEHPLTQKARQELLVPRVQQREHGVEDTLYAFRDSLDIAVSRLGLIHPMVTTFSGHLQLLEQLRGSVPSLPPVPESGKGKTPTSPRTEFTDRTLEAPQGELLNPTYMLEQVGPLLTAARDTLDSTCMPRATTAELPTIVTTMPPLTSEKDLTAPLEVRNAALGPEL